MVKLKCHVSRHAIAYVALFVALSGGAYAASLPRGSVGTAQLKKNAVTSPKVKNGALLRKDFKSGQLPRGEQGPQGPQGPAGIATIRAVDGPASPQCANGSGGCQVASSNATCPAGSFVVGGGFDASGIDQVVGYAKRVSGTTFGVIAINYSSTPETVQAQAICASGPGLAATARVARGSVAEMLGKLRELRLDLER